LTIDCASTVAAHVLELVVEFDLFGDGDAVFGDARGPERLVEHHVAALGAESDFHCICQNIDAAQHAIASVGRKFHVLGGHECYSVRGKGMDHCPAALGAAPRAGSVAR
jgi:hypothetical protein